MISSLTEAERAILYNNMIDLIRGKSKFIDDNYDPMGTSGKYFSRRKVELALSEVLGCICDYIYRPDRYVKMNPTIQYIWADIVIDILLKRYNDDQQVGGGGVSGETTFQGNISEIKVGGTTVKVNSSSDMSGIIGDGSKLLKDYINRLNRYRRPI